MERWRLAVARRAGEWEDLALATEPLEIVTVGETEIDDAVAILRRYSDQALTLTDAAGLSLMKTRRIRSCWSTDRQLGLSGVPLLIHEP
ncbi:MAG TPA: hypothetical protein VE974_23200 [Thermoanaerobaculia bacterium]|nr:hypothetical protein [Thermoanaerobaculia bacterium]